MAKWENLEIGAEETKLWTWTWGRTEISSVQGKVSPPVWQEQTLGVQTNQVQRNMTWGLMGYKEPRNLVTVWAK